MARINSNIPSVIAQSNLASANSDLELRLERLSTGLRINRGRDDPAGLIISERLRADIGGVEQAVRNADRASAVIATTEASLAEVNDLLVSIRALVVEAANTGANSVEERDANQLQIDSAIDSITRISNTASFGGLQLLDGSLDYTLSGIVASQVDNARVLNASFAETQNINVDVEVVGSAQVGGLYFNGSLTTPDGIVQSNTTLEITGSRGVQTITVPSGATLDQLAAAVNAVRATTGISAALINGNAASGIQFNSVGYGSEEFVSVVRQGGPDDPADSPWALVRFADNTPFPDVTGGFPFTDPNLISATRDTGQDVTALVNGNLATGRGLDVNLNTTQLGVELLLDSDFATDPQLAASSFTITGGGALFQIGPEVTEVQQTNIGIQSLAASDLGGTLVDGSLEFLSSIKTGGGNSIAEMVARGDFTTAQDILNVAIDEVSVLRGRLGAFERNVLQTNVRSLQAAFENLSASDSIIRDADFARETSELTRAQTLSAAGTSVLQLANQQAQSVLQLLG